MNKSTTVKTRLEKDLARRFSERCAELGMSQSEVLRRRIEAWLRQTSEIKRLKTEDGK